MFKKILIANRGEIALRILRACHELGIRTVTVYSTADSSALHALISDEAVCIGPPPSKDSYLNMSALITAAKLTGAEAIHPGFGFLSENSTFVRMCDENGIKWIGPSATAMDAMGDKANAKKSMIEAGVPVVPGSNDYLPDTNGVIKNLDDAKRVCKGIGYPVLVKASAGGGGRGIRMVNNEEELESQIVAAQQEALNFFSNDDVYIEKFIVNPRHVEVQLIADEHGHTIHLGERDCSCQRRNQKVLEESPSPVVDEDLRKRMGEAAVKAAQCCNYYNAGTIEFLVDKDKNFYFMEMNARIQVEHPVTEMVTGVDLVKRQIRIAAGEHLDLKQSDIVMRGHVIECRINAEDPRNNFRPCPGKIQSLLLPGGFHVRVETAIYQGYTIPMYYDSMVAKVIVKSSTRNAAVQKMRVALSEFLIEGVTTNIDFHLNLLKDEDFLTNNYDIGFLNRKKII